jgi:sigma-B regulation protein RsbU (phosphoserine phosphatase)
MQKKLSWMVNDTRQVNNQLAEHNDQLTHAYQLKMQTNRRRTAFIQNMYHEIRTPLNIISGFSQVLTISLHSLPAEEVSDITSRMKKSADDISHLAQKLEEVITDTSEPVIS